MTSSPAVVVDCDGLLVDTEAAWAAAAAAVFPGADGHAAGVSVGQLVELHANGSAADREALAQRLAGALVVAVRELGRPMPGAAALLERLEGIPHVVASNAPPEVVRAALAHLGAAAAGLEIVALEPPFRPKPAPDLHLEACRRIGAQPTRAVALEDSVIGARAAAAAGLWVVGVGRDPGLPEHADLVIPDLDSLEIHDLAVPDRSASPSAPREGETP